ncbi:DUF4089 domain-containing protein [Viridibacterium curvum]|uniref:DUF4089 domain-containing protein n=1 Tax=Viridibacterium curvum TaxID=1101404 RepID=A0ABP9QW11_9RHOO
MESSQSGRESGSNMKSAAEGVVDWRQYALAVSAAQGYALDAAQLERVVKQLELVSAVAAPLLALELPVALEPAPVFKP